jgi:hypothetical protein
MESILHSQPRYKCHSLVAEFLFSRQDARSSRLPGVYRSRSNIKALANKLPHGL